MRKIELRLARYTDWPKIREFHEEQNQRDGTSYAIPDLFAPDGSFAPGIVLAIVGETDGAIIQCFWFEARTVECCFAGCDPRGTSAAWKDIDFIAYELSKKGFAGINCKVPKQVAKSISKPLRRAGFADDDKDLKHFYRSIVRE